jgi:hypothetical protein
MPPQGQRNSGLSIGALICGIAAFLLAWIPCVNFIAPLLALVALILGIVAWVQASKDPTQKPIFAIVAIVLSVLTVVAFIASYWIFGRALMEAGGQAARSEMVAEFSARADVLEQQARDRGVDSAQIEAARANFNAVLDQVPADLMQVEQTQRTLEAALEQLRSDLGLTLPAAGDDDADEAPAEESNDP